MILGGRLCEQSVIALVSDTIIHHKNTKQRAGWGRGFLALFGAG